MKESEVDEMTVRIREYMKDHPHHGCREAMLEKFGFLNRRTPDAYSDAEINMQMELEIVFDDELYLYWYGDMVPVGLGYKIKEHIGFLVEAIDRGDLNEIEHCAQEYLWVKDDYDKVTGRYKK